MSRKFRSPREIIAQEKPQRNLQTFRDEVEVLQLTVRRNLAQEKLTGYAVDSRLESFIDIELHIEHSHPEVLVPLIEERNSFLKQVGLTEAEYLEMKAKDLKGRQSQRAEQPNMTEQLHAIHDEIQNQGSVPLPEKDDTTVKEEAKVINMADTSNEPKEE